MAAREKGPVAISSPWVQGLVYLGRNRFPGAAPADGNLSLYIYQFPCQWWCGPNLLIDKYAHDRHEAEHKLDTPDANPDTHFPPFQLKRVQWRRDNLLLRKLETWPAKSII